MVVDVYFDDINWNYLCYNGYKWRCDEKVFDVLAVWFAGDFLWGVLFFDDGVGRRYHPGRRDGAGRLE